MLAQIMRKKRMLRYSRLKEKGGYMTLELVKAVIERSNVGRTSQTIAKSVGLTQREVAYIIDQFRYGQNMNQIANKMNSKGFQI